MRISFTLKIVFIISLFLVKINSTVLTFDLISANAGLWRALPQTYGDEVGSIQDTVGKYRPGFGFTKNVTVNYESIDYPGSGLAVYGAGYGDLKNVAFTHGTGGRIILTPKPGYQIRVNRVKLGAWQSPSWANIKMWENSKGSMFMNGDVYVLPAGNTPLRNGRENWVQGAVTIQVTPLYNIGISEVDFDERPIPDQSVTLAAGEVLVPPDRNSFKSFDINIPNGVPAGKQCRIYFKSRLDYPSLAGLGSNMYITVLDSQGVVHGTYPKDLLNKDLGFVTRGGRDWSWYVPRSGGSWINLYAPNFNAYEIIETTSGYGIPDGLSHPYEYLVDITDYIKAGVNKLRIQNYSGSPENLIIKDLQVEIGNPILPLPEVVYPAPTGTLSNYVPKADVSSFNVYLNGWGDIKYAVNGVETVVKTSSTNPGGGLTTTTSQGSWLTIASGETKWSTWYGLNYRVDRAVTNRGDHIYVEDRYRNQGTALIGLEVENELVLNNGGSDTEYRLSGRKAGVGEYKRSPGNSTAVAFWPSTGKAVGLFAHGDIFKVQAYGYTKSGAIGIGTYELGIPVGDTWASWRTLEWGIVPQKTGDYWTIINTIRKNIGSNYNIPGPIVFAGQDGTKSAEYYRDWISKRGVKVIVSGQATLSNAEMNQYYASSPSRTYYAYGTMVEYASEWLSGTKTWFSKINQYSPDVKKLIYMHSGICTHPATFDPNFTGYNDSKMLDSVGNQYIFGGDVPLKAYLSTKTNTYGVALFNFFQRMFTDPWYLNFDGLNGDEFFWTQSEKSYLNATEDNWDGVSVDLDGAKNVFRKFTRPALAQQSHRVQVVDYLKSKGKMIMTSGAAETATMLSKQLVGYAETLTYSDINDMHLGSPIGYGNHDSRQSDRYRSKMLRSILERGGLMLVAGWEDEPSGQHYIPLIYPITPVYLGAGFVIGLEKLITCKSGVYGWENGYDGTVYVFNGQGILVNSGNYITKSVVSGKTVWEFRAPSDHFMIIIRK